ncbi:hypothetical protein U1Q18_047535, partial [Sarracenia purpurea var. burkii]
MDDTRHPISATFNQLYIGLRETGKPLPKNRDRMNEIPLGLEHESLAAVHNRPELN